MQGSLLSSSWCCRPCRNGVAIANAQASLQSRHLCSCHDNVVALVVMAMLLSSIWCCCPHHNDVVAIVNVQASLPVSLWHCCLHCAGAIAIIARVVLLFLCWCCRPYCSNLFPLTSHGRCHRRCTGIVPLSSWRVCAVVLVLLPLSRYCCHPWYTGISTLVT